MYCNIEICSKETKSDSVDLIHLEWDDYQWRVSSCEEGVTVWTPLI